MGADSIVVAGIPIPSTDPLFLAVLAVHVPAGVLCVIVGAAAILTNKGRGRHSRLGIWYYRCLMVVVATMGVLSVMRWKENYPLFILGALSMSSAHIGRRGILNVPDRWTRGHIAGMGASYVFLLTAFYVDNGKNLPLWRELPQVAFWLLPGAIGIPFIVNAMLRHPLVRRR